ncbi:MAG: DUF669 domain-containing protein [Aestuariivirga sp.]
MATLNLNTADLPEPSSVEPVPAGEYLVEITESDAVANSKNTGELLKLTMRIIDGDFIGQMIWDNISYRHENPKVEDIGKKQINSICRAIGFDGHLEDSTQLHGQPLVVRVTLEQNDPQYAPKNVVKAYKPWLSSPAPAPAQQARAAQQPTARQPAPAAAAGGKMPWKR